MMMVKLLQKIAMTIDPSVHTVRVVTDGIPNTDGISSIQRLQVGECLHTIIMSLIAWQHVHVDGSSFLAN